MLLKQLFDQDTWTYTYLLADPETREAIIIDPVIERVDRDTQLIAELGLELLYTLETHIHADHVTGSGELRRRTGALSAVAAVSNVECADRHLVHGDQISFGRYQLEVRSTPGHTGGCLTFVARAGGQTMAFTGDALFIRGCGRTDFQQGDAATLYRSVHGQIYTLPPHTIIYPGHDYRGHSTSTVQEEQLHNPRLNIDIDEAGFLEIMDGLNLDYPKRIHEALPANMTCGLPASEEPEFKTVDPCGANLDQVARIIDVRSPAEFDGELGHLPGAELAPLARLTQRAATWPKGEPLLVTCRTGQRSHHACTLLTSMGFTDVTNLDGGLVAWHQTMEAPPC